jgi:hypothetical protein
MRSLFFQYEKLSPSSKEWSGTMYDRDNAQSAAIKDKSGGFLAGVGGGELHVFQPFKYS